MLLVRLSATFILYAATQTHLEMKEEKISCFQPLDNDDKYSYFNETNQASKIHSDWVKSLNIYHSTPVCSPESICVFTLFTLMWNATTVKWMGYRCVWIPTAFQTCRQLGQFHELWLRLYHALLWLNYRLGLYSRMVHVWQGHTACAAARWPLPGLWFVINIFHHHHQHTVEAHGKEGGKSWKWLCWL